MPAYCTDTSRRTCPPKPQCRLSCNPIERHTKPCKPPLSDPNRPPPCSAFPFLPFGTGTTPNTNNSAPIFRSQSRYRPTLRAGCNRSLKATCKSWPITDREGLTMRKRHSAIPSQTELILAVLQNGKTLTAHDMHQMGIMQCNTRILELRRAGHQIVCIMEQVENQYGQTVRRGRYLLASTKAV